MKLKTKDKGQSTFIFCHPEPFASLEGRLREGSHLLSFSRQRRGNPEIKKWIPAFAGMTAKTRFFALLRMTILLSIFVCSNVYAAPKRIVSLKPNITSILIDIGAKDEIVGITRYCIWPDSKTPARIADYLGPKIEAVLALKPDMVISSEENSVRAPIETLRNTGVNVILLPFGNLGEISGSIRKIGELTGHIEKANDAAKKIDNIKETKLTGNTRTLIVVGTRPIVAAGRNTFFDELINYSGGMNAAPDRRKYPNMSAEELAVIKPDVIIDLTPEGIPAKFIPSGSCRKKLIPDDFQADPKLVIAREQIKKVIDDCRSR